MELGGHACPYSHNAKRRDDLPLPAHGITVALREVEDQVKAETISLIETRLCEVLGGRRKHDTDSGELFPQGLLHIVGVSTAADT